MNLESCLCQICFLQYDGGMQLPKLLDCGHSLCSKCLYTIPQVDNCIRCPMCRKMMIPYAIFPTNYTAVKLIEDINKTLATMCKHHPEHKADFLCLYDEERICLYCKAFGDHKGHDLLPLEESKLNLKEKAGHMEMTELNSLSADLMRKNLITSIENAYDQMIRLISEIKVRTTQKISKEFEKVVKNMQSYSDEKKQLETFRRLEKQIAENNNSNEVFSLELLGREFDSFQRNDDLDLKKIQERASIFCHEVLKALDEHGTETMDRLPNEFNEEIQNPSSTLNLSKQVDQNSEIWIFIKTRDGPLRMKVKYSDCLADIRQRLVNEGKCSQNASFKYENRPLNMNSSFYHYNFQNNVQLILKYY